MLVLEFQILLSASLCTQLRPAEDLRSQTPHSTSLSCSGTIAKLMLMDDKWFDSLSLLESDSDDDFSSVHGDFLPGVSNGQVLQYETSSCFVDSKRTSTEYHERFLKIDLSKEGMKETNEYTLVNTYGKELLGLLKSEESGMKRKKNLDHAHASFEVVKDEKIKYKEKSADSLLKSVLPRLAHSVSFNDMIHLDSSSGTQSHRKKSTVIRLSVTRTSVDGEDTNDFCASTKYLYRPRVALMIPCCKEEKPTSGTWSEIEPSTFKLRGENYFKNMRRTVKLEGTDVATERKGRGQPRWCSNWTCIVKDVPRKL